MFSVLCVIVSNWSMFVESSTFLLIHNQWYLIVSSLWCGFVHNICDAVHYGTRPTSLTLFGTMYSDYWFADWLATRGTKKTLDWTNGISSCFCLIWPVSSTSSSFSSCQYSRLYFLTYLNLKHYLFQLNAFFILTTTTSFTSPWTNKITFYKVVY